MNPLFLAAILTLGLVPATSAQDGQSTESGLQTATFAGGCFWCMEPPYDKLDGVVKTVSGYVSKMKIENYPYVVSLELGMKFEVSKLPYAVLIDEQGVLRSKGLVNSREHLESLVESMRTGYESIQDYLVKEELIGEQA